MTIYEQQFMEQLASEPQIAERFLNWEDAEGKPVLSPEFQNLAVLAREFREKVAEVDGMVHLFILSVEGRLRVHGIKFYRLDDEGADAKKVADGPFSTEGLPLFLEQVQQG